MADRQARSSAGQMGMRMVEVRLVDAPSARQHAGHGPLAIVSVQVEE